MSIVEARPSATNLNLIEVSSPLPILRRILSLLNLNNGWHYGSGRKPTKVTVDNAITIVRIMQLAGAEDFEAFPEEDGGILVAGYNGNDTMEVLCRAEGTYDFTFEIDDEEKDSKDGIDFYDVAA